MKTIKLIIMTENSVTSHDITDNQTNVIDTTHRSYTDNFMSMSISQCLCAIQNIMIKTSPWITIMMALV